MSKQEKKEKIPDFADLYKHKKNNIIAKNCKALNQVT